MFADVELTNNTNMTNTVPDKDKTISRLVCGTFQKQNTEQDHK